MTRGGDGMGGWGGGGGHSADVAPFFSAASYMISPFLFNKKYMTVPMFLDWYMKRPLFSMTRLVELIRIDESTRKFVPVYKTIDKWHTIVVFICKHVCKQRRVDSI